ncbi:hypothetical protein B0H13DRAFT_1919935 [Mycena leptocephala]|nr:hypothetical protein B0H13DRAFT_1919935 [Mycena leptocephala]
MHNSSSFADPGIDTLQFRSTRSGCVFSEWSEISAQTFDIATTVVQSLQLNHAHNENLPVLDSGPLTLALAATQPQATSPTPSLPKTRSDCDKARSKLKCQAQHHTAKAKTDIWLNARLHHPCHLTKPLSPIKAKFEDGGVTSEEDAKDADTGLSPTHTLPNFFGDNPTKPGFTYVPMVAHKQARPIIHAKQKVWGVFGGMPDNPNFMRDVRDPAVETMEKACTDTSLADDRWFHRCGNYPQLSARNSYSSGPSLMGVFYKWYKNLKRPFLNGIFSACAFNLGPYTCALGHRDFTNLACGWCAITAFGDYNYTKGRHLILWDCKLILEFPPGCMILIPAPPYSTPTSPSPATNSASRLRKHGFQTEDTYLVTLTKEEQREEKELGLKWYLQNKSYKFPYDIAVQDTDQHQIGCICPNSLFPSTTTITQTQSLQPNTEENNRQSKAHISEEMGKKSDLAPLPPSRTPAARCKALAKYRDKHCAMTKANPAAYAEKKEQTEAARVKYEQSHKGTHMAKQILRCDEAKE